jgi:hypothetical protein
MLSARVANENEENECGDYKRPYDVITACNEHVSEQKKIRCIMVSVVVCMNLV